MKRIDLRHDSYKQSEVIKFSAQQKVDHQILAPPKWSSLATQ